MKKMRTLYNIYKYISKEMISITIVEVYYRGYCITMDRDGYDAWDIDEIIQIGLIDAITHQSPEISGCDTLNEIKHIIDDNIKNGIYENR